ncbi:M43 family zinc metalloprotease [Dyadobacter psychrotolerans]|nr:M43 family zinc metalloprotease [Dyadobacter psychrotolerans]
MISVPALAQQADSLLIRCVTAERDSIRISGSPMLRRLRQDSETAIQEQISRIRSRMRVSADAITIPVVVHVVHNQKDNRIGGTNNSNISDEQIQSQIDVLNEDYANKSGYKGFYTDSLGVDTGIRFKLVGVVRKYDAQGQFSAYTDDITLATISPPWPTSRYLNIWVCSLSNLFLGVAQFPVITQINKQTTGLLLEDEEDTDPLTDGVIIDSRYFGRNSPAITSAVYNLGRTTTHEVGHWLGLFHIWGVNVNGCGTDYCDDTPRAQAANETTDLSCSPKYSTCGGALSRNMIENYMDYSPDRCMSVFTQDQKNRMYAVLELSPRRAKLVEYAQITTPSVTVELFPNPAQEYLNANIYTPDYKPFTVSIFNVRGVKMSADAVNETYINVKNYPAGLYFLRVNTDSETVTKRFLVR